MRPTPLGAKAAPNQKVAAQPQRVAAQSQKVPAAKIASDRGRLNARNYRAMPGSVDAIRAKVKAEMKAEAAASKAHAQEKIDLMEAEKAKEEEEKLALRQEARRAYSEALAEEVEIEEQVADVVASQAEEEPSHVERITALLKERSERMRADKTESESLRQRAASRRLDSDRFGAAAPVPRATTGPRPVAPTSTSGSSVVVTASAVARAPALAATITATDAPVSTEMPTAADPKPAPSRRAEREVPPEVIKRSLFQWAPPEPADAARLTTARGAAAGLRGAQASEAGRDAWAWLMRPAAQPQEEEHEEGSNLE